jgi:hypothetical protein
MMGLFLPLLVMLPAWSMDFKDQRELSDMQYLPAAGTYYGVTGFELRQSSHDYE